MAISLITANSQGGAPAFSAYQSSSQTLATLTITKIQFQTKEFDTANAFDAATNYRFQPLVAGYYQVFASLSMNTTVCPAGLYLYKNGSLYKNIFNIISSANVNAATGGCLVYLNGSTDYIEIYGQFGTGQATQALAQSTYFQACFVRSA